MLAEAGQVIARDPPQKTEPEDVTADERQDGLLQSLVTLSASSSSRSPGTASADRRRP